MYTISDDAKILLSKTGSEKYSKNETLVLLRELLLALTAADMLWNNYTTTLKK